MSFDTTQIAMPEQKGSEWNYADPISRLVAGAIDGFIFPVLGIITGIIVGITAQFLLSSKDPTIFVVIFISCLITVYFLYFGVLQSSKWRATPGKMALQMIVVDGKGRPLSFWQASNIFLSGPTVDILVMEAMADELSKSLKVPQRSDYRKYILKRKFGYFNIPFLKKAILVAALLITVLLIVGGSVVGLVYSKIQSAKQSEVSSVNTDHSGYEALVAQLANCWDNIPPHAQDAVEVVIDVNPDRTIREVHVVDQARFSSDKDFQAVATSALQALSKPECKTLNLPADNYNEWKKIDFTFDPRDFQR